MNNEQNNELKDQISGTTNETTNTQSPIDTSTTGDQAEIQTGTETKVNTTDTIVDKTNFVEELQWTSPVKDLDPVNNEILTMPTTSLSDVQSKLESISGELSAQKKEYLSTLYAGAQYNSQDDGLVATILNELSEFHQIVESGAGKLALHQPKFKIKEGVSYSGEAAKFRIRSSLGMGTATTIPLWHTGIWVTLKTPKDSSLLELYRQLSSDKVKLGRDTFGLLLSNGSAYTVKTLLDFIIDHIFTTSLVVKDIGELPNYIRANDIPILIWGMASAIWHRGFHYNRGCVANHNECNHVVNETIDLKKIHWTNTKALTTKQINHMTRRDAGTMSLEEIKAYQNDFNFNVEKRIDINEEVGISIRIPTAVDHVTAGDKWISNIEQNYPEAMMKNPEEREEYLYNQSKATNLRQYSHFINKIYYNDEPLVDQDFIDEMLDELSGDDVARERIISECQKFIDDTTMSLIAIPTYKCPACGAEQSPGESKGMLRSLIPLDVINCFFILLVQKIRKIESR